MTGLALDDGTARRGITAKRYALAKLRFDRPFMGRANPRVAIFERDEGVLRSTKTHCRLGYRIQDRLHVGWRLRDGAQDFCRRGLLLQRLAQLGEQADVLDGDHRLGGEGLEQLDLLLCERPWFDSTEGYRPNGRSFSQERRSKDSAKTKILCEPTGQCELDGVQSFNIRVLNGPPVKYRGRERRLPVERPTMTWRSPQRTLMRRAQDLVPLTHVDVRVGRATEANRSLDYRIKHRLHVGWRTRDDFEDVGSRRLPLQRRFGVVARSRDCILRPFALGDVAVNYDRPASWDGIAAHLDRPSIRPGALGRPSLRDALAIANHLLVRIAMSNFPALGQQADVVVKTGTAGQEGIGYVKQLLEITIPSTDTQVGVEHRHAVAHMLERDAEFLLPPRQFAEQAGVLHSDDGLVGKCFDQFDLPRREGTRREALKNEGPNQIPLATQKHAQRGAEAGQLLEIRPGIVRVCKDVRDMDGTLLKHRLPEDGSAAWQRRVSFDARARFRAVAEGRS